MGELLVPVGSSLLVALGATGAAGWIGPLLDKAAERLFDGAGKRVLEEVRARLRAYTGNIPINHDLEQVIRLTELTSTLMVLAAYRRQDEGDRFDSRGALPSGFIDAARKWLHEQIGLSPRLRIVPNETLVGEINKQLDELLAADGRERVQAVLKDAERQVWHDLMVGLAQRGVCDPPEEFAKLFFGDREGEPGWSVTFLALIREALKNNPRAEVSFVTTRLAIVRGALQRIEPKIEALQIDVATLLKTQNHAKNILESGLADLLGKQEIILRYIAENRRGPIEDLRKILEKLGEFNVPDGEIITRLSDQAAAFVEAKKLLNRLSALPAAEMAKILQRADRAALTAKLSTLNDIIQTYMESLPFDYVRLDQKELIQIVLDILVTRINIPLRPAAPMAVLLTRMMLKHLPKRPLKD